MSALASVFLVCCIVCSSSLAYNVEEVRVHESDEAAFSAVEELKQAIQSSFSRDNSRDSQGTKIIDDEISGYLEVNSGKGNVLGQTNSHSHSFFSIPFAEPPTGDLR